MWRDRLSAHTTPSRSPAPPSSSRNSLQVDRPNLGTRGGSSLSVLSNPSSTSLTSSAKPQNASGLKIRVDSTPPPDVEDPLAALERLVGAALEQTRSVTQNTLPDTQAVAEEIDFQGKSLQEFVDEAQVSEDAHAAAASPPRVPQSVEEYGHEKDRYDSLHSSITECDEVLKSVENYLANFQADLGVVSAEIEHIQTRSTTLNAKLENRKNVEKLLGPVVAQIALSPVVVRKITDGAIDEAWVDALDELQSKEKFVNSETNEYKDTQAVQDLKPVVEDLCNKAVERIRDYFAARVKSLRLANVHAGVVQNHDFLRFKSLFAFLAKRQPKLAEDLNQAYANGMRFYYGNYFSRYRDALMKLKVDMVDSRNTLGDDSTAKTGGAGAASRPAAADPFNIGRRADIVKTPSNTAIPASIAEESKQTTSLETPFYSFHLALIDNASSEFNFLSAFLPPSLFGAARIARQFNFVFSQAFEIGQAMTKTLVGESYDAFGVLLAVRLTQHFAFKLQRRRIPTMDNYINGSSMQLWPRFQQIMDAHCESLKRATSSLPSRLGGASGAAGAAFATLAGTATQSAGPSTAPHRITQRFANLLRGLLVISSETRDDEPVANSVGRLRDAYDAFVSKMRQGFGSGEKGRKERERFVASNYGLITAVLEGPDVTGRLAEECRAHFAASLGN